MADPEEKPNEARKIPPAEIALVLNEVAATEAGVKFLRWLKERCFFERSTIVGNPETYEINSIGTIAHEVQRRLYLDIRRHIKPELRKKIEY